MGWMGKSVSHQVSSYYKVYSMGWKNSWNQLACISVCRDTAQLQNLDHVCTFTALCHVLLPPLDSMNSSSAALNQCYPWPFSLVLTGPSPKHILLSLESEI